MSVEPSSPDPTQVVQAFLRHTKEHAVIVLDPAGQITAWQGGAERLLGWAAREACGQPLDFIFTKDDRARGMPRYELSVALASGVSEDDRWHVRRDGTAVWVTGTLNAVRAEDGELLGFVKLFRDRTDLRAHLSSVNHRLEEATADQVRYQEGVARLVHEIRNPLGVIVTSLDISRRRLPATQEWTELLAMMERQAQALGRMSDDLMEVVRSRADKLDLQREALDLAQATRQAVVQAQPRYDAKPVKLTLVLPQAAITISADAVRVQQILANLLDNALKFTPPQGHVVVTATLEADSALVRVKDNGIGITASMLPRIFDLFAQEDRGREHSRGGIGLGLALVKELAQAHGGNAEARSAGAGKGSEFSVRLPMREPPRAAGPAA